jgi:hypothetical protein
MSDRKPLPGKFVWFEHVSKDAKKVQAFYGILQDPTGATLAIMKPLPRQKQP